MSFAQQVKNSLLNTIFEMSSQAEVFSKHPKVDFSRNRNWIFLHYCIS